MRASRRRGALGALGLLSILAVAAGAEVLRFSLPAELSIEEGGVLPILILDGYLVAGARVADTIQFVVAPDGSLQLTLIRNAGFLIAARGRRVLIDALYKAVAEMFPDLVDAGSRFDADLVLATRSHPDHFDPAVVARCLESHPAALSVGPRDAAVRVIAEAPGIDPGRVTGAVLERFGSAELERSGIALTLFDLPRGKTPNVAYLIDLGGIAVFHTGDHRLSVESIAAIERWGLRDRDVAVALALPVHFSGASMFGRLRDVLGAEAYAPMHVKPGSFSVLHRLAARRTDTIVLEDPLEARVRPPKGG